ncbi:MAG: class I fructose-bisphosphate aldolase [Porticoccaceae bacterium]
MNATKIMDTASALVAADKGLLAMDESNPTYNKRFACLGISQTEAARRTWRELIVTTPGLGECISGEILYDETIRHRNRSKDGTPFIKGIIALFTAAAVWGGAFAHGTPVEKMKPSVVAAEIGKGEKPSRPPEQLYGTWTAKDVDAKMGEVRIRLTFRREGKATLLAWSDIPFAGQVRDLKGSFSVHGDTIRSAAIRDGKKAKFSFESDQLVLRFKSGKVVRFDRE